MRTTLSIDTPILDEVKRIQRAEGGAARLEWISKPMSARVDLDDREAVYAILDGGGSPSAP